jgi:hypothetical protein
MSRADAAAASELQVRIWFNGPNRQPAHLDATKLAARAEAARMNRILIERNTFAIADLQPKDPLDPPAPARARAPAVRVAGRPHNYWQRCVSGMHIADRHSASLMQAVSTPCLQIPSVHVLWVTTHGLLSEHVLMFHVVQQVVSVSSMFVKAGIRPAGHAFPVGTDCASVR